MKIKHDCSVHKYKQIKVNNLLVENTRGLWDKLEKKIEIQQFIHSTNTYLLSNYYVPGTMQMLEEKTLKTYSLYLPCGISFSFSCLFCLCLKIDGGILAPSLAYKKYEHF